MDREFLEKLFSRETSDEEREMLCEVAYGRPFLECLGEIRRDDFTLGLESGKYRILSVGSTGEKQESVEIRFICTRYGDGLGLFGSPEIFLYQSGERSIPCDTFGLGNPYISHPPPPPEYCVTFYKAEIDDAMLAALRGQFEENMLPFDNILAMIKTQGGRGARKTRRRKADRAGTGAEGNI